MGLNVGFLTSGKTVEHQETFTPYYAVDPILKYVKKEKIIWCPFDKEWSAFYQTFVRGGYRVVRSHIDEGKDFFKYEPEEWDVLISNPPYSIKDAIIKRVYELNKPFALLLPLNSLQGKQRYKYFKNGIQLLSFDSRIGYHRYYSMDKTIEETPFASAYFCRDILPNDLIVTHIEKDNRGLLK